MVFVFKLLLYRDEVLVVRLIESNWSFIGFDRVRLDKRENIIRISQLYIGSSHSFIFCTKFTASGSLWVRGTLASSISILQRISFWSVREGTIGSYIWRKLLKLRSLAASHGESSMFWWDNWTGADRLIVVIGYIGPQHLGLQRQAFVFEASLFQNRTVIDLINQPNHSLNSICGSRQCSVDAQAGEYWSSFSSIWTLDIIRYI